MFFLQIAKDTQKVPVTIVDLAGALLTGLTAPTVEITKNGAAYAAPNLGTFTEISDGDYTVTLDETDTNTLGWLILRVKDATSSETKVYCEVSYDAAERVAMAERIRVFRRQMP
jgi:hypothetical protein